MTTLTGNLAKMRVRADSPVAYELPVGDRTLALNPLLGAPIRLEYAGRIQCVACGRVTRKSYSQGHCYPCSQRLASCDLCIVRPETCHFAAGTCREPDWAQDNCMRPHVVYLSNTSGVKVGITRATQVPTRWIDQGAVQALPIVRTDTRHRAGLLEATFRAHVADRTDWRHMLRGIPEPLDLAAERDRLFRECAGELEAFARDWPDGGLEPVDGEAAMELVFPIESYPGKIKALNLDKQPVVEGRLIGIKGQYLILDAGVLNVRKFTGYEVTVSA